VQGIDLRLEIAPPSAATAAVHAVVRAQVDRMDVDREVAGQIAAVDAMVPEICAAAAAHCPGLR
jgi:histidine ammonia-lyase